MHDIYWGIWCESGVCVGLCVHLKCICGEQYISNSVLQMRKKTLFIWFVIAIGHKNHRRDRKKKLPQSCDKLCLKLWFANIDRWVLIYRWFCCLDCLVSVECLNMLDELLTCQKYLTDYWSRSKAMCHMPLLCIRS